MRDRPHERCSTTFTDKHHLLVTALETLHRDNEHRSRERIAALRDAATRGCCSVPPSRNYCRSTNRAAPACG